MYRRPKFLEVLLEIRRQMAVEADHDVRSFVETANSADRASPLQQGNCDQADAGGSSADSLRRLPVPEGKAAR